MNFEIYIPNENIADNDMLEYLRCYGLPSPTKYSYGNCYFPSSQSHHRVKLFGQIWLPKNPIGCINLLHGFAEHMANYARLINEFLEAGFIVSCLDLRGHGLSEGVRGHVDSPQAYAEDLEQWINLVLTKIPENLPLYIWGHSMGGMLSLQILQRNKLNKKPKAVSVTSPLLGLKEVHGVQAILLKLTPLIAKFSPSFAVNTGHEGESLSNDPNYLSIRLLDPLIHHQVSAKWILSAQNIIEGLQTNAKQFEHEPACLMLLAGDEQITDLLSARKFAINGLSSLKHKVVEFPGYKHELEKCTIRPRVVKETIAWFKSHH